MKKTIYKEADFDKTRSYLFEGLADEYGWTSENDIPENMIYNEMSFQNEELWNEAIAMLDLEHESYIACGTCGRWNGNFAGGNFIVNYRDLQTMLQHLDSVEITDEDGHLYINGYHHDGSDSYELKRLTKKGYEYARNNYFDHDRKLHNTIFNTNFFSALPRIAERF